MLTEDMTIINKQTKVELKPTTQYKLANEHGSIGPMLIKGRNLSEMKIELKADAPRLQVQHSKSGV